MVSHCAVRVYVVSEVIALCVSVPIVTLPFSFNTLISYLISVSASYTLSPIFHPANAYTPLVGVGRVIALYSIISLCVAESLKSNLLSSYVRGPLSPSSSPPSIESTTLAKGKAVNLYVAIRLIPNSLSHSYNFLPLLLLS